ncbi:MAG: Gldg family protein [Desulfobacteraceae bacterium]|nr:Gldg family protein [Desulfobacteraceae bacterium]
MGVPKPTSRYLKFLAYLAVVVLINVAGTTLFFRLDLTEDGMYSLSPASRAAVADLSEPLTIQVFFTQDLPAPHNATEQYLRDLLDEYAGASNRFFNFRFYEVSADEGDITEKARRNQELAQDYGIHPIQIQTFEKDEVKFQKAYMGLVLIHGDIIERIPTITGTDGLEYRLTTAIGKLKNKVSALLALEEKIQARLYFSSSLKPVAPLMGLEGLENVPEIIRGIVQRLNGKNYGKIAFSLVDPSKDPQAMQEAQSHNVMHVSWPALPDKGIEAGNGSVGLVLSHGDKWVSVPVIQVLRLPIIGTQYSLAEPERIEEFIDGSIASLIDIHQSIGALAGKGTLDISGQASMRNPASAQQASAANFRRLLQESYSIKDVDLEEGIPSGIRCLIVAQPTEEFSDYELFQIDQFLMKGNSLAFFVDPFKEILPPRGMNLPQQGPVYRPLETGLEKLLAHWGLTYREAFVLDEHSYRQRLPEQMGGGERNIYFAPLIQKRFINNDLPFMENINGLVTLQIAPLQLDDARITEAGLTAHRLFSSSEKAWEMSGDINLNPAFLQPPTSPEEEKSMPLAYLVEGPFPSYFAGKPIPEKPQPEKETGDAPSDADSGKDQPADASGDGAGEKVDAGSDAEMETSATGLALESDGTVIGKGRPGKVLLIASSQMLQDTIVEETGRSPNAIFAMNVIDHLNGREEFAVLRAKQQEFNPLMETSPALKTVVKAANIVGLPVAVVLFGLVVWARRAARKRRIQAMFQR